MRLVCSGVGEGARCCTPPSWPPTCSSCWSTLAAYCVLSPAPGSARCSTSRLYQCTCVPSFSFSPVVPGRPLGAAVVSPCQLRDQPGGQGDKPGDRGEEPGHLLLPGSLPGVRVGQGGRGMGQRAGAGLGRPGNSRPLESFQIMESISTAVTVYLQIPTQSRPAYPSIPLPREVS